MRARYEMYFFDIKAWFFIYGHHTMIFLYIACIGLRWSVFKRGKTTYILLRDKISKWKEKKIMDLGHGETNNHRSNIMSVMTWY